MITADGVTAPPVNSVWRLDSIIETGGGHQIYGITFRQEHIGSRFVCRADEYGSIALWGADKNHTYPFDDARIEYCDGHRLVTSGTRTKFLYYRQRRKQR